MITNRTLITAIICCTLFFELNAGSDSKNSIINYEDRILEDENRIIKISFGQNFSYKLDENSQWTVINQKDQKTLANGIGSIDKLTFTEPGIYLIQLTDNKVHNLKECDHDHSPSSLIVEVSSMEMIFDFSSIQFSQGIIGGQEFQNIEMSIEVDFRHYNNQSTEFSNSVRSAGVGANIIGNLSAKQILTPGKNKLIYQLSGSAAKNTYIMFDFIDVNGQIQTYYHTSKIN